MMKDRTIVVDLNEHLLNGFINEGLVHYKPGTPRYDELLRHIGGLKVGQSKMVPPWGPPE
jgi:hypothetical protein